MGRAALILCAWALAGCGGASANGDGGSIVDGGAQDSSSVVVAGGVVDFQTGQHASDGRLLRIMLIDPLCFALDCLPGGGPSVETASGSFSLSVTAPAAGLLAVVVTDPMGATPASPLAFAATSFTVVAGGHYEVDGYEVLKSTLDGWAAVDARFGSMGSFAGCFFRDPPPAPAHQIFDEVMPANGVRLLEDGSVPSLVRYLGTDGAIDPALTSTGTAGCSLIAGTGNVNQYTGAAGGVTKWETIPGMTVANAVFIQRLHSCDSAPAGTTTCQ